MLQTDFSSSQSRSIKGRTVFNCHVPFIFAPASHRTDSFGEYISCLVCLLSWSVWLLPHGYVRSKHFWQEYCRRCCAFPGISAESHLVQFPHYWRGCLIAWLMWYLLESAIVKVPLPFIINHLGAEVWAHETIFSSTTFHAVMPASVMNLAPMVFTRVPSSFLLVVVLTDRPFWNACLTNTP